jgi:two-component system, LuxR family, sensor kinase FixL
VDGSLFVLWTMVAAASLTLAAVHGLLWLLERRNLANLCFCVVAVSVAAIARIEFGLVHSSSPEEYAQLVRWFHLPLFFFTAGLVLFVRTHFRAGRDWLGWTVVALRGIVTLANLLGPSTATWQVLRLEQLPLLGELAATSGAATIRPLQGLATATAVLLIAYVLDAAVALWRRREREARRKAALLGGAIVAFLVIATVQSQLVVWGLARMPVMISPPFLIMLAAMTYELCREIVASARIEREAREQRAQLKHLSRVAMLGELSGGIAHELNQPLTAILSNAQAAQHYLANKTGTPEVLSEILHDIVLADQHAGEVIGRLRALFRQGETQFGPLEVNTLVSDVLDIVRGDLVTRGIEVERELAPGLPKVSGDRIELQQVLLNLVVNACEAMSSAKAGAARKLILRTFPVDGSVAIEVEDTGPGFGAEQPERIFEPFYTTKPQGLGLGLSISQAIIRAHRGRLRGDAQPGRGACFRIELPKA